VLGINIRGNLAGGRCFLNAELKRAAKPPVAPERVIDISAAFAGVHAGEEMDLHEIFYSSSPQRGVGDNKSISA
jgi:hypothetical protein